MMRISLVTVGDPSSQTGGHLYHRRLAEGASRLGAEVEIVALGDERLVVQRSAVRGLASSLAAVDAVVVDSLAAAAFAGQVRAFGVPVVGLVHQRPGGPIPSEMRLPM